MLRNEPTLFRNIKSIFQISDSPLPFQKGEAMSFLSSIDDAYLLIKDGLIQDFGSMTNCPTDNYNVVDCSDQFILPTWCDSHSHIVYAGSREGEFVMRVKGASYEDIASAGGGILNSARKLQGTSEDELFEQARRRLEEVQGFGTGALEIKSGYGLTTSSEIKMLRVIKRLAESSEVAIKSTFLGAHAIPTEYKSNRAEYIRQLIEVMLPQIADEGLADYIDVFCDKGFFTVEETDKILKAGAKRGLKAKIHANELAISGGVQVGIANEAISVDHLEALSDVEIELLSNSNTIATLLPSTSFFLNLHYAEARKLIDQGAKVSVATDYNPGSTPSGKMPFILALCCLKMKMTPEEAINAATINGAYAMELNNSVGSIEIGKKANIIITKKIPSLAFIPYSFGSDLVQKVYLNGKKVVEKPF